MSLESAISASASGRSRGRDGHGLEDEATRAGAGAGDRDKCIFCKIVDGKAESDIVHQVDSYLVFRDIRPAAKNHLLVIPKDHIKDAKCINKDNKHIVSDLMEVAKRALVKIDVDTEDVIYGFHWPPFHTVSHLHLHAISPASEMGYLSKLIFKKNSMWFVTPEYVMSRL